MIQTNNDFSSTSSSWSWHQDKLFERALVMFQEDDESPDRWEKIAGQVPGKSAMEVKKHYDDLEYDVMEIELGRVELPSYKGELESESWVNDSAGSEVWLRSKEKEKERESERRKGVPWTEEEHRLFLIGLQKYGKGDWRSISRNAVVSRTPTQVASHAQKYFLRLNSVNKKDRKRSSIHDITMANSISLDQSNNQNRVGITTADHSSIELMDESKFFNEQGKSFGNNHGFESPLL